MASGKVHARGTSRTLVIASTFVASIAIVSEFPDVVPLVINNWSVIAASVAGLAVGHYASPDVRDQQGLRNHGEKMVEDDFGKLAGKLWTMWWEPMAKRIEHRNWKSHMPGVATLIAAAWLYWLPLAFLWWYGVAVPIEWLVWHLAGWAVQDAVHLWQDGGVKRIRW